MNNASKGQYWTKVIIMFCLFFCGWFIPEGKIITSLGMKVVGIFAGMMFGWIFLDLVYPSFLGLLVLALAGFGESTKAVFGLGFGAELIILVILFGTFSAYMNKVGLSDTLAKWFLTRKIIQGKPWLFIFLFFVLTYVLGIMIDIYPTIFLLWPVCYKICEDLGYEKRSAFTSYLCFSVPFISGLGMVAKPFSIWCLPGLNALKEATGLTVNYTMYTFFMTIVSLITIVVFMAAAKYLLRLDVSKLEEGKYNVGQIDYTHEQKIASIFVIALFVIMYAPSILPDNWWIAVLLNKLDTIGRLVSLLIVLGIVRTSGGEGKKLKKLADVADLASSGVPFNMVFLLAATQVLGAAVKAPEAGITPWIGATFAPMMQGLSPVFFYLVLCIMYGIATQFVHNLVLLVMLTPIAIQFGTMVGANPIVITFLGLLMLSAALATPGASSRSGLVYANDEYIHPQKAYLLGLVALLATLVGTVIFIPLALVMFPV